MQLEDAQPIVAVQRILQESLVTVVTVHCYGDNVPELTYKDAFGRARDEVLYQSDDERPNLAEKRKTWSFAGDGALFRLVDGAVSLGGEASPKVGNRLQL